MPIWRPGLGLRLAADRAGARVGVSVRVVAVVVSVRVVVAPRTALIPAVRGAATCRAAVPAAALAFPAVSPPGGRIPMALGGGKLASPAPPWTNDAGKSGYAACLPRCSSASASMSVTLDSLRIAFCGAGTAALTLALMRIDTASRLKW